MCWFPSVWLLLPAASGWEVTAGNVRPSHQGAEWDHVSHAGGGPLSPRPSRKGNWRTNGRHWGKTNNYSLKKDAFALFSFFKFQTTKHFNVDVLNELADRQVNHLILDTQGNHFCQRWLLWLLCYVDYFWLTDVTKWKGWVVGEEKPSMNTFHFAEPVRFISVIHPDAGCQHESDWFRRVWSCCWKSGWRRPKGPNSHPGEWHVSFTSSPRAPPSSQHIDGWFNNAALKETFVSLSHICHKNAKELFPMKCLPSNKQFRTC